MILPRIVCIGGPLEGIRFHEEDKLEGYEIRAIKMYYPDSSYDVYNFWVHCSFLDEKMHAPHDWVGYLRVRFAELCDEKDESHDRELLENTDA